jgi:hypothetical protein
MGKENCEEQEQDKSDRENAQALAGSSCLPITAVHAARRTQKPNDHAAK